MMTEAKKIMETILVNYIGSGKKSPMIMDTLIINDEKSYTDLVNDWYTRNFLIYNESLSLINTLFELNGVDLRDLIVKYVIESYNFNSEFYYSAGMKCMHFNDKADIDSLNLIVKAINYAA